MTDVKHESVSTSLFGTRGSCTCGFADVPPELPCEVHVNESNKSSNERVDAVILANRLLDQPYCDPDDDLRVLSRQLLRLHEERDILHRELWTCDRERSNYRHALYEAEKRLLSTPDETKAR